MRCFFSFAVLTTGLLTICALSCGSEELEPASLQPVPSVSAPAPSDMTGLLPAASADTELESQAVGGSSSIVEPPVEPGAAGAPMNLDSPAPSATDPAPEPEPPAIGTELDELRMDLVCVRDQDRPCEPQNADKPQLGYLCCYLHASDDRNLVPRTDKTIQLSGDPDVIYDVTLRIRGVVENHHYEEGRMPLGEHVMVGGPLPDPGAIHVFGITVADPLETYYLNSWNDRADPTRMLTLDYEVTIPMRGSSSVRVFEYDDIGKIWKNAAQLTVPELPPYPEAFAGQFMQLNIVSVSAQ